MDIIVHIYKNYACNKWINNEHNKNKNNIQIGNEIKLLTGHIGKIVCIQETNSKECIYDHVNECDLHTLCIDRSDGNSHRTTTFIGIILNEIDNYYGHNGSIGCSKYFESLENKKGLLVPIAFIESNWSDNKNFIRIGDRVETKNGKFGYVKYIGRIANGADITQHGLELDIDTMIYPGNDGSFNGVKYFDTTLGRGYFTTADDLIKIINDLQQYYDIIVTNLTAYTAYNDLMEWLKENDKLKYVKSINVYKHNGLIEGIIQVKDINEQIYILNHLNNSKIGNKYVGVFTREQYKNTVLCLNCNKNGHFIKDCPNTIALSDTIDNMTIDDETYSNFVRRMTHEALQTQTDLSTVNSIVSIHPPPASVFNEINNSERYLYSIEIEKLYLWSDNEWGLRTSKSKIEFFQSKKTGKIRLVVRDPITFKLKLNHFIPSSALCTLQRKANTFKCWQWKAFDNNNNENGSIFCAKFNNENDGNKFYEFFINIQKNNKLTKRVNSCKMFVDISFENSYIISINCHLCKQYFDTFDEYKCHLQKHYENDNNKQWLKCDLGCVNKIFKNAIDFIQHIASHSKQYRPFKCNISQNGRTQLESQIGICLSLHLSNYLMICMYI